MDALETVNIAPISFGTIPLKPAGTFVYIARDKDGSALYVGITDDLCSRFAQHRLRSPWWSQAHGVDFERFAARAEAVLVERVYIHMLRPPHNSLHAGKRKRPPSYRGQRSRYLRQQDLRAHLARIAELAKP